MNKFAELLNSVDGYKKILESIKTNTTIINGVTGIQKRHFAFSVAEALARPFLFVVQNDTEVEDTINDLAFFSGKDIEFFPEESKNRSMRIFLHRTGRVYKLQVYSLKESFRQSVNLLLKCSAGMTSDNCSIRSESPLS